VRDRQATCTTSVIETPDPASTLNQRRGRRQVGAYRVEVNIEGSFNRLGADKYRAEILPGLPDPTYQVMGDICAVAGR
jgi:hypothetical protein